MLYNSCIYYYRDFECQYVVHKKMLSFLTNLHKVKVFCIQIYKLKYYGWEFANTLVLSSGI